MSDSRNEIDRLREFIENNGYAVYQVQTDAVFVNCENPENVSKLQEIVNSYPTEYLFKFKHHEVLYHFNESNTYLSLVSGIPCIKGFVGRKPVDGKLMK
jgi:hypothetical protein